MSIEAMKQALDWIESTSTYLPISYDANGIKLCESLRQAIAEAEKQCQYPNCDYPCMDLPDCQEQDHIREATKKVEKQEPIGYADFHISSIFDLPIGFPLYTHPQPKASP